MSGERFIEVSYSVPPDAISSRFCEGAFLLYCEIIEKALMELIVERLTGPYGQVKFSELKALHDQIMYGGYPKFLTQGPWLFDKTVPSDKAVVLQPAGQYQVTGYTPHDPEHWTRDT